MTQQLSLFAEDIPRARWDKRLANPSTSPSSCSGGTSGRRLGHEIDDVMQQYVQRAHQLQVLRRRTT
ncbi:MAG: hypothetical protein ACE5F6_02245 [Anaerolineae bacterium]